MVVATRTYFSGLADVLGQIDSSAVDRLVAWIERTRRARGTVYVLGNGGSAATASHLAVDLAKNTRRPDLPNVRAISLTDNPAVLTAWSNDTCYEQVFAAQIEGVVGPGDLVVAISASGNSPNVLAAVRTAEAAGAVTFALTGFAGGKVSGLASDCVVVPSDSMQVIEDAHLAIVHAVVVALCDDGR
jgi:D-sedoheptulose 7-phosphate isomerase